MPLGASSADVTTYGDVSPRVGMAAAAKMLEHARPILVLNKMGQVRPMPKNKGQQLKFRRPVPFEPAVVALSEGVAPDPQKMVYADVTAYLNQYGSWSELTDVIADTHEDPVLQDMSMLSGEQAAETVERLTYGTLIGGTAVGYAGTATARNEVNEAITLSAQRKATRMLKAQRAKKISKILGPSVNISTVAVEAAYVALGHTDLESDIRELPGFVPVAKYGTRKPICAEEIGSVEDVRYVLSPFFDPWHNAGAAKAGSGTLMVSTALDNNTGRAGDQANTATGTDTDLTGDDRTGGTPAALNDPAAIYPDDGANADVYPVLFLAQEAFGTVPLKGKEAIKPMVLNPNIPRHGDPLGQSGSVSWKTWHASLILNQAWIYRLEVAATAL